MRTALETAFAVFALGGLHRVAKDDRGSEQDRADDQAGRDHADDRAGEAEREGHHEHRDRRREQQVTDSVGDERPLGDRRPSGPDGIVGLGHPDTMTAPCGREPVGAGHGAATVGPMTVRTEWRERTMLVTIDRPDRRNAVDLATLVALRDAQRAALSGQARVLVLTGAPPAFCAGADLADVESDDFVATLAEVLTGFGELPFVTIAAVEGAALGAGTQLAIACDLRVATAPSQFGIPAARLGLAVDSWTVQRLTQEMGASVARAMLLAAQTYSGEHLAEVGAVHRIGDLQRALAWAEELGGLAPLTIRAHKLAMERALAARPLDDLVETARQAAWASADLAEGRRAFMEKRRPEFRGE